MGIGQAIVNEPPVLIFDEPTVGLDPAQIKDIRELIKDLGKTSTVILSTHILPEVSLTCSRIVILNHGKVVATDTPDNLERKMQKGNHYRVVLLNPPNEAKKTLSGIAGVTAVTVLDDEHREGHIAYKVDTPSDVDASGLIAATVVEHGWNLVGLQAEKMSLEDIFIDIVKNDEPAAGNPPKKDGAAKADAAGEEK